MRNTKNKVPKAKTYTWKHHWKGEVREGLKKESLEESTKGHVKLKNVEKVARDKGESVGWQS